MFTHKMLIPIAYNWAISKKPGGGYCTFAFKEFKTLSSEQPDVIGFRASGYSVLIEVKISRSDFLCDKNKPFRKRPEKGMGMFRFYMCPEGLIKRQELPENWGLIYVNSAGEARLIVNPYCVSLLGNIWLNGFKSNMAAENDIMFSALRRLHLSGDLNHVYDKNPK